MFQNFDPKERKAILIIFITLLGGAISSQVEKLSLILRAPSSIVLSDLAHRWSLSAESMTKDPTRAISELRILLWCAYSKSKP